MAKVCDNVNLMEMVTDMVRVNRPLRWYALHSEQFGIKLLHICHSKHVLILWVDWGGSRRSLADVRAGIVDAPPGPIIFRPNLLGIG